MWNFEKNFFEKKYPILTGWLKNKKTLLTCFKILYYGLPVVMIVVYVSYVIHRFRAYGKKTLLKTVAVPGFCFAVVSLFRRIYNQKRPYENFDFTPLISKNKKGRSMPSRHTFSAGIISAAISSDYPILAPFMWVMTGLIALTRLIAGVHHLKDIIVALALAILTRAALSIPVIADFQNK